MIYISSYVIGRSRRMIDILSKTSEILNKISNILIDMSEISTQMNQIPTAMFENWTDSTDVRGFVRNVMCEILTEMF